MKKWIFFFFERSEELFRMRNRKKENKESNQADFGKILFTNDSMMEIGEEIN